MTSIRLLAALLVIGAVGLLLWLGRSAGGPGAPIRVPAQAPSVEERPLRSNLVVELAGCRRSGDTLWTEGSVRNDGRVTVRYIEVELTLRDASGNELGTEITPVVGSESLMPGEGSTFEVPTVSPQATDCDVSLFTYEPTP